MSATLAAAIIGLCGGSVVDSLAPVYTICVGALIVAKYLAEQKPGGLGKEIGEDELEEDVSSSNSSSAGGGKPLPPLKEPVTGIFIPATLEVEGGAGPLVSVGCGPRIKKLGFIEVKVYALGVFVEASATSQAALEPLQGADVFKALLSQDPATFFRRALHLVFARSVTGKQVADALAEKLKAALSPEAFNAFSQALLAGIGPKGLAEGDALSFVWTSPDALRLLVRGQPVRGSGELVDAATPRVLHAGIPLARTRPSPKPRRPRPKACAASFTKRRGAVGAARAVAA